MVPADGPKPAPEEADSRRHRGGTRRNLALVATSVVVPVVVAFITTIISAYFLVNKPLITTSKVAIDAGESRQGRASVSWDFTLQAERRVSFVSGTTVGAFLHFEISPDKNGTIQGMDWRRYVRIKLFAKSSVEGLGVTEVNLFTGPNFVQYTMRRHKGMILSTRWREFELPLSEFVLAPWESTTSTNRTPDLSSVVAFGFDEKTSSSVTGIVWVDFLRLTDGTGRDTVVTDAETLDFAFHGRALRWVGGARQF